MYILKWTNIYSGESGFVKVLRRADGHFVNTFEIEEAKRYSRKSDVTKALNLLQLLGEAENNHFEVLAQA